MCGGGSPAMGGCTGGGGNIPEIKTVLTFDLEDDKELSKS